MPRFIVECRTAYGRTIYAVLDMHKGMPKLDGMIDASRARTVARCDTREDAFTVSMALESLASLETK